MGRLDKALTCMNRTVPVKAQDRRRFGGPRGATAGDAWPHVQPGMPGRTFSGIASGGIRQNPYTESSRTIASRDINPQVSMHILVIPRERRAGVAAAAQAGEGRARRDGSLAHRVAAARGRTGPRPRMGTGALAAVDEAPVSGPETAGVAFGITVTCVSGRTDTIGGAW